jgi:hypothetical protein
VRRRKLSPTSADKFVLADLRIQDAVFICDWLPPDFGAVGQYTLHYAQELAAQGRGVTVFGLSSAEESIKSEQWATGCLKVVRVHAPMYDRSNLRQRAWWTLRTNFRLVWRALRDMRESRMIVFTGSPPFLLHLMAPLNLLLRKELVYRITDFFPECLMAEYSPPPLPLRLLQRLTLFWRRRVSVVEVLGEDQRRRLAELGIPMERVRLRRDSSPVAITADTKPLARPLALSEKKVLLYSGNFGVAHDHETFLAAYRRHHRKGSGGVRLWLNAQGARADALERSLETEGLPFHRTKPVPLDQLASLLITPDAHLITLRDEFVGYVLPSKVYGCIESGKPIVYIGSTESDVHLLCSTKSTPGAYFHANVGEEEAVFRALETVAAE